MKNLPYLIISFIFKSFIYATNYYVAVSYGDDNNNGLSVNAPFKTIVKAASVMSSGDICYIRQGDIMRLYQSMTLMEHLVLQ